MNDIQVARYSSVLHKLLGIETGSPAPTLAPELIATIPMSPMEPDWAFLAGERLCYGGSAQVGVAGELSHIQLLNRTRSAVCVVREIRVETPGQQSFITIGNVDAVFPGASVQLSSGFLDSRLTRTANRTAAQIWRNTNAVSMLDNALFNFYTGASSEEAILRLPVVLTENRGIGVRSTAVNETLGVQFVWTERYLEPSESR